MPGSLDGNIFRLQFRLHDNTQANSPKAIRVGGGPLRSDLLSLGEPGFNPVNYMFSIGIGDTKGWNVMAGNFNGDMRFDLTPFRDRSNHQFLFNRMHHDSTTNLELGFDVVKISPAFNIADTSSIMQAVVGYGHLASLTSLLLNIKKALKLAVSHALTLPTVDAIFEPPGGVDLSKLSSNFGEEYGYDANLLTYSEVFNADTLDGQSVTNLALVSRSLDIGVFTFTGVTATLNVNVNTPRGDNLGDSLIEDSSNGAHNISQNYLNVIANTAVTYHRKIKPNGRTKFKVSWPSTFRTGGGASATFDLTGDGTVTSTTGSSSARVVALDNGWYWIAHTVTGNNGATTVAITEAILDGAGAASYIGSGSLGFILDELQLEAGTVAHKPIDTVYVQVTSVVKNETLIENDAINFDTNKSLARLTSLLADPVANSVYIQKNVAVAANNKYCISTILKKGTAPYSAIQLLFTGGVHAAENVVVKIDWNTKSITVTGSNSSWQGGGIFFDSDADMVRLWASGPAYDHTNLISRVYVRDNGTAHGYLETVYYGSMMANIGIYPAPYIKRAA